MCPSRGDVAALVYLAKLCGLDSGSISVSDLEETVEKLLG